MAGYIHEFFGYRFDDHSDAALKAAEKQFCPFIGELCTKPLGRDGERSGACTIRQSSSPTPVICCPHRLYADEYKVLHIIAEKTFNRKLALYPGRRALAHAPEEGGAVAVFGHKWGKELKLPKRDGVGNYFADWVLAYIDEHGKLAEFTSVEVQTIDTTGNYRDSRSALLKPERSIAKSTVGLNWENVSKRIIPQLIYKGQILQRESLCRSGLWFVTPTPIYERLLTRLGGPENLDFGYAPQPGALHFLRYDFAADAQVSPGSPLPLDVTGYDCTTVERVQGAFNRVRLPEPDVYGSSLESALYSMR
ncbi:NotI family restriction endonuclease [Actinomyces sp.]